MKPVIRYQSQLLYRKSYKPNRVVRIRLAQRLNLVFRPLRTGKKSKSMNAKQIETKFAEMGARLKVREIASRWQMGSRKWIDPVDMNTETQSRTMTNVAFPD